jgi:hypothetical protein
MNKKLLIFTLACFYLTSASGAVYAFEILCNNNQASVSGRNYRIDCFNKNKVLDVLAETSLFLIIKQKNTKNNQCITAFENVFDISDYLFTYDDGYKYINYCNTELINLE